MKKTKTQLKIDHAVAFHGVSDMTVLLEKVETGDMDKVRQYVETWLEIYAERLFEAKLALKAESA